MLSVCVFIVVVFRWWFFEWLLGTKRMLLLDSVLFTIGAAMFFADSNRGFLNYLMGSFCVIIVLHSSVRYMRYDNFIKGIKDGNANK